MNNEQLAHIAHYRAMMQYALARMTVTFAAVPDEHIDWTPSPSAKSALHIVSHCVDANRRVASVLRGELKAAVPDWNYKLGSKDEALYELALSVGEFEASLDSMTPELYSSSAESPAGATPLPAWMHFIGHHLAEHAADQTSRYPEA